MLRANAGSATAASEGKNRDYQVPIAVFAGAQSISYAKAPTKATVMVELHALVTTDGNTPFTIVDDEL